MAETAVVAASHTARDPRAIWNTKDTNDLAPAFAELRALGPVHRVVLDDGVEAWLIVRHDEAKIALGDPRFSKDMHAAFNAAGTVVSEGLPGPAFARHMLAVDPPDHTRLRRLVANAFTNKRVDGLTTHVHDIANELLDRAVDRDAPDRPVDLVAAYALPLPFTVICELLGVEAAARERFGRELRLLLSPATTPTAAERAQRASDEVVAFLGALVASKRTTPGDDLVSDLIAARAGADRLTQQELLSTIFQLIIAGHDTTASDREWRDTARFPSPPPQLVARSATAATITQTDGRIDIISGMTPDSATWFPRSLAVNGRTVRPPGNVAWHFRFRNRGDGCRTCCRRARRRQVDRHLNARGER